VNRFTVARSEAAMPHDPCLADVTTQLMAEFGAHVDRAAISGVVQDGLHDLQCSPAAARVVGLERLARNRLITLIEQGESQAW
jgi:formate-dependent phosphoribosylglycinamide formyltransferase (GAR transformylase)